MRKMFLGAGTAVAVLASVLLGGLPAMAASVPPNVMGECESPPDRGGWNLRDTVTTGTYSEDDAPVRGRTLRLAEPCWGTGSFSIPVQVTDIPADILDDDEDGQDDGAPSAEIIWTECAAPPPDPASRLANRARPMQPECNRVRGAFSTWRANVIINVTGTSVETNLVTSATGTGTIGLGRSCVSLVGTGATGTTNLGTLTLGSSSLASVFTRTTTNDCATGSHLVVFIYYGASYGSTVPVSILYGQSGAWDDGSEEAVGSGYYGGTQEAPMLLAPAPGVAYQGVVLNDGDWDSRVDCAASYDGPVDRSFKVQPTLVAEDGAVHGPPVVVDGVATDWTVLDVDNVTAIAPIGSDPYVGATMDEADCPYINTVVLTICQWAGNGPDTWSCGDLTWTADRWRTHNPYTGTEGGPPGELLCTVFPATPGCYEVLNPPYIDGTDFDVVCADPPAPVWLDFNWLPALIGHYAECLFIPVNGWDRNGEFAASLGNSPFGDLGTMISDVYVGLGSAVGTCGAIVDGNILGAALVIDTCAWDWAPPLRSVLVFGVLALGGFAVASFALRTVQSLRGGDAPDPLGGGK